MKLKLKTSYRDVELLEIPGLAVVTITPALAARILRFQKAVKQMDCYCIEEFNYAATFTEYNEDDNGDEVPGEPLRTECNTLVVTSSTFWWRCYVKHTDVELAADPIAIDKLHPPGEETF